MSDLIYHLAQARHWRAAGGRYCGGPRDRCDGYIHFSTAAQVVESAARHLSGVEGLVLIAVRAADLGAALRWEPRADGVRFPHLYAALDRALVVAATPLGLDAEGRHVFPPEFAAAGR